jgi:large subunit ribosomal protein L29
MSDEKMKAAKMRDLSRHELEIALKETKEELWNLEFRRITQEPENPLRLRALRRQVARIETLLNEDAKGIHKLAAAHSGSASAPAKSGA